MSASQAPEPPQTEQLFGMLWKKAILVRIAHYLGACWNPVHDERHTQYCKELVSELTLYLEANIGTAEERQKYWDDVESTVVLAFISR